MLDEHLCEPILLLQLLDRRQKDLVLVFSRILGCRLLAAVFADPELAARAQVDTVVVCQVGGGTGVLRRYLRFKLNFVHRGVLLPAAHVQSVRLGVFHIA